MGFVEAMKSKSAAEVRDAIMKVFVVLTPSDHLQSDNGREFKNKILKEAVDVIKDLQCVDFIMSHYSQ